MDRHLDCSLRLTDGARARARVGINSRRVRIISRSLQKARDAGRDELRAIAVNFPLRRSPLKTPARTRPSIFPPSWPDTEKRRETP